MLKLYDYYRSSACFRVRIALNLKNLPYDTIAVHLLNQGGEQFSEQYTQLNPQQLVPTLLDHSQIITQSLAIIEYLEEMHPQPSLFPKSAYAKAQARAFALTIAADMHPLNNLRVLKYLTNEFHVTEQQKQDWYLHWMQLGLQALEKQLGTQHKHDFCFGNAPTIADICLIPQLYNARRFACHLTDYPTLVRIDANCQQLPAFQQAWPEEVVTE